MKNYPAGTPVGNNQVPLYNSPAPFKAIGQYANANNTASSVISMTDNTTAIEIGTGASGALMRWVGAADTAASVTGANFDHFVPANSFRRFVVPIEVQNNSQGYSSMVGQRVSNGLFARVATQAQGTGSVLLSEYGTSNSY